MSIVDTTLSKSVYTPLSSFPLAKQASLLNDAPFMEARVMKRSRRLHCWRPRLCELWLAGNPQPQGTLSFFREASCYKTPTESFDLGLISGARPVEPSCYGRDHCLVIEYLNSADIDTVTFRLVGLEFRSDNERDQWVSAILRESSHVQARLSRCDLSRSSFPLSRPPGGEPHADADHESMFQSMCRSLRPSSPRPQWQLVTGPPIKDNGGSIQSFCSTGSGTHRRTDSAASGDYLKTRRSSASRAGSSPGNRNTGDCVWQ
mmetsp:Transcript_108785/g.307699  ORF Transcript_108785/g.307699 Transcript_108785/m.307699 type:complete len:261 (-) Transcript_108785:117-899(-)